jgi:hypothetical protein
MEKGDEFPSENGTPYRKQMRNTGRQNGITLLPLVLVALDTEKPRLTAVTERNGPVA